MRTVIQSLKLRAKRLPNLGSIAEDPVEYNLFGINQVQMHDDIGLNFAAALYEVMPMTDRLKEMVLQGCSTAELKDEMIRQGIRSLRLSGLGKALEGITTVEEVCRVTAADKS